MLLPFIAWAATGMFFFFKPGYKDAYQALNIKHYPLGKSAEISPKTFRDLKLDQSQTLKQARTVLGHHLLVKSENKWRHYLLPNTSPIETPSPEQVKLLIRDAISENVERYGEIELIDGLKVTTSTKVEVTLNWSGLTLRQYGLDTDLINTIYDIHYLRWTGHKTVDQYLGVIGLILVVVLAIVGTVMTFRKPKSRFADDIA